MVMKLQKDPYPAFIGYADAHPECFPKLSGQNRGGRQKLPGTWTNARYAWHCSSSHIVTERSESLMFRPSGVLQLKVSGVT